MSNTNTNTSISTTSTSEKVLSNDVYEISNFVETLRANTISDLSDTASMVGIYGHMNEITTQSLQNTLIVASETSNETIATRAKFAKNVLAHAFNLGIKSICATPAVMTLMIYLPISSIEDNWASENIDTGKSVFIFDKDIPISVDRFEFHADYDILITRVKLSSGKYQYSAMYDLFDSGTTNIKQKNPISDITNPYITTLVQYTIDGTDYLAFSIKVHQVSNNYIVKPILTGNPIENKTFTFEFGNQLVAFDLDVTENGIKKHLVPVYNGLADYTVNDGEWCNYEYLNENTIRVIFNRDSYVPTINAEVTVNVKLSEGAAGNFTFNTQFRSSLISEKYNNYNGMYMIINPLLNGISNKGKDKKSIADIRKIFPKEASSRGAIINTVDLENYFNSINDTESRLTISKKMDNQFGRLYYAHMLIRKNATVYPTNTVNLKISQNDFKGYDGNNNLSINPGTKFYYYDTGSEIDKLYASVNQPTFVVNDEDPYNNYTLDSEGNLKRVFEYMSPFLITVDDDLLTSYLLTTVSDNKTFRFDSINSESNLQFIATNMFWNRKFIYEDNGVKKMYDNKYTMTINMTQNNSTEYNLVKTSSDANGNTLYSDIRVKMYMVLYTDETENTPYRYIQGNLTAYEKSSHIYEFKFVLETDDLMDLNNRINIKGIYNAKPEEIQKIINLPNSNGYMNAKTYAKIFIMADFSNRVGDRVNGVEITDATAETILYGSDGIGNRTELEAIIPTRDDIVSKFLKNEISIIDSDESVSVVTIIKSNPDYINIVKTYNGDELETEAAILKYIRNNMTSDFVNKVLLKDEASVRVIDSYNYENLSTYTVCNVLALDEGVDFYYDYSNIMSSTVDVLQVPKTDANGNPLYKVVPRTDSLGNSYDEMIPIFKISDKGSYLYDYTIKKMPVLKYSFINTEAKMTNFIFFLEERRKYINECLEVLEDTYGIDLKFFNTYGPSRRFYYEIPNAKTYNVKVNVKSTNVLSSTENENTNIIGTIAQNTLVTITKTNGQWGYINSPIAGWIKLANTTKIINYIDNVSLKMSYALEAQSSADKGIANNIKINIKDYVEDINEINELHVPNIITLITNNYRDQLIYFEFLDINNYGVSCQHLYMEDDTDVDVCPEFLNIDTDDETGEPDISITVY